METVAGQTAWSCRNNEPVNSLCHQTCPEHVHGQGDRAVGSNTPAPK